MNISEQLRQPFPEDKIEKNYQGQKYIPPQHVIDRINNVCGMGWDFQIRDGYPMIINGENGPEVVCIVRMFIDGHYKDGVGSDQILWKSKQGNPMPDAIGNAFKGATSNALKLAAKLYGVANQLWGGEDFPETATNRDVKPQDVPQMAQSEKNTPEASQGVFARENAVTPPETPSAANAEGDTKAHEGAWEEKAHEAILAQIDALYSKCPPGQAQTECKKILGTYGEEDPDDGWRPVVMSIDDRDDATGVFRAFVKAVGV